MSEVMITIIDAERAIHDSQPGCVADAVIAALTAEPETIAELEIAVARFLKPTPNRNLFASFFSGISEQPWDAGIVLLDLSARVLVAESTYSQPARSSAVCYHDGERATEIVLPYTLSEDWLIENSIMQWRVQAPARRQQRTALPPLDARVVLYGKALSEFIARACQQTATQDEAEAISEIHARWLLTPRADLRAQTPRELLLAKRDFIESDVNWRAHQWAFVGECPPGLELDSAAYRYAGFGTHENVVYYELVRHLLTAGWQQTQRPQPATPLPLEAEIERLERLKEDWLSTPSNRYDVDFSPLYIIEQERQRLPVVIGKGCEVFDEDCPHCQAVAGMDLGPMFWHLDGSSLDEGFVFSFHCTVEEYEAEQREWQEMAEKFERERQERLTRGEPEFPGYLRGEDLVYADEYSSDEEPDKPEYLC